MTINYITWESKNKKKTFLFIPFLLLLSSCAFNDTMKIKNAKKIKSGMNMQMVKDVMGMPNDSLRGYFDTSKLMFLYNTSFISSDDIEIYFDSGSKLVTNVILPKGE